MRLAHDGAQAGFVIAMTASDDDEERVVVAWNFGERFFKRLAVDRGCLCAAGIVGEIRAVVDDGYGAAEHADHRDERHGDVPRAADDEVLFLSQHFGEDAQTRDLGDTVV